MDIGDRIKFIRGDLTQKEFGQKIKADQSTVQVWETRNNLPKGDILQRIHQQFGVNVNWLLTGEGDPYIGNRAQDRVEVADGKGLWGDTRSMEIEGKSFMVTTYEPENPIQQGKEGVKTGFSDSDKGGEIISEDELALVRALRRAGEEYKKRVYMAVVVRAQNATDENILKYEERKRFRGDLEILTTKAIE